MRRSTYSPIRRGIRTCALLAIIGMVFSANADEQKINRLDSLKVNETAQATEIVVSGSIPPTFTVFKLTGPTRLFIDISNADISSISGPIEVENGVISQITPLQFTDELVRIGRLVIGLETDAIYSVNAKDNSLVITVDATQRKPEVAQNARTAAEVAAAEDRADKAEARARTAEAKARLAEAEAQRVASQARAQAETSASRAAAAEARAQSLVNEVDAARKAMDSASKDARAAAEAKVAQAEAKARQADITAQAARAEANAAATVASTRVAAAEARAAEAEARVQASESQASAGRESAAALNETAQRLSETAQSAVERAENAEKALAAARERLAAAEQRARQESQSASARIAAAEQRAAEADQRAKTANESANIKVAEAEAKARQAEVNALKAAERSQTQADAAEARASAAERKATALVKEATKARDQAVSSSDSIRESANQVARAAEGRAEAAANKAQSARAQAAAATEAANARALAAEARANEAEARAKAAEAQAQASEEVASSRSNDAERLARNAEAAERRARQAESNLEALHGQLSQAQAQIDRSEKELTAAVKRTQRAQESLDAAKNEAERANAKASLAESQIAEAKSAERAAQARASAAEQRATTASRASEAANALAQDLRKQVQSDGDDRLAKKAEAAARTAAAEARATQLESDRAQLAQKVKSLESERSQARAVIATMQTEKVRLDQQLSASKRQKDSAKTQMLKAERRANDAAVALEKARVSQIESAQASSRLEGQLKSLEAQATRAQEAKSTAQVQDLNRRLAAARERASQLEVTVRQGQTDLAKARQLSEQRKGEADALRGQLDRSKVAAKPAPAPAPAPVAKAQPQKRPMLPPPPPQMRSRVVNVKFSDGAKRSQIEVIFEGKAEYTVRQEGARTRILELKNALIDPAIERSLDTSEFGSAVQLVSSFQAPPPGDRVRIVVTLSEQVKDNVKVQNRRLSWSFDRPSRSVPTVGALPPAPTWTAPSPTSGSGSVVNYEQPRAALFTGLNQAIATRSDRQAPPTRRKRYSGRKINIDIKDGDIHNILRLLAKEGNVNIVTSDEVEGTITMHLKLVPWDQALDIILRTKGLDMVRENDIIRVAPIESIAKEREAELKKQEVKEKLKPLEVKLITVNHASASDLMPRVKSVLSKRGTSEFDNRTNTVILKDVDDHLDAAEDMIRRLDTQTPQVLIETRIVEVNEVNVQQFGIQWGVDSTYSAATGNPTGLRFPSSIGIAGGADDQQGSNEGVSSNPNYVVNLPASAGLGSGGALGLTFGSIDSTFNLNVRLTALENRGSVKIVSSPKITTLDNKQAEISQGVSIPISQVSASGIQTVFFDAVLALRVTPHVTQDGNIYLKLNAQNNTPDFQNVGARGDPTILKKEAKTELLLKDGDTTVIGGIYTSNAGFNRSEVPYLARIPILGAMFRNHQESDRRSELLIFVTPRIVNRAASQVRTAP